MIIDTSEEQGDVRHVHKSVDEWGNVVLMVTTIRPDETVRVISYRRAKRKERELLRQNTGYAELTDGTLSL
jgi:uncharacterized DUF497 family protein